MKDNIITTMLIIIICLSIPWNVLQMRKVDEINAEFAKCRVDYHVIKDSLKELNSSVKFNMDESFKYEEMASELGNNILRRMSSPCYYITGEFNLLDLELSIPFHYNCITDEFYYLENEGSALTFKGLQEKYKDTPFFPTDEIILSHTSFITLNSVK